MSLMRKFGVPTLRGDVASSPEEAVTVAKKLNSSGWVVKAQILAGGRGKGTFENGFKGGVQLCDSIEQVKENASKMLGNKLITKQTGPAGKLVSKLLIVEKAKVSREIYLAITMDRTFQGPVIVTSTQGGMDIEKVAAENPKAILKTPVDILRGISPEQTLKIASDLGFTKNVDQVQKLIAGLYDMFIKSDATLLEINPLSELSDGRVVCMDCKINIDDNAEFRQNQLFELRDITQEDPLDVEAAKAGLTFINLDGDIGCMVNGAGLAMATLDIINAYGGSPANFLDVGGGATADQVTQAMKIITSDKKIRCILVNIFGGIMRCDTIALGLISAMTNLRLQVPLVVRLQGTKVAEAKKLMQDSGFHILSADDLDDAAEKAVRVAKIVSMAEGVKLKVSFELPL